MDKIILPETDEELLKMCSIDTFRSSGPGGQHVNKTDSAVRLTFLPQNIVVTSQTERSQFLNKQNCLKKLRQKVEKLNYRPKKRIPTKISRGQKQRNVEKKRIHGQKKKLRTNLE